MLSSLQTYSEFVYTIQSRFPRVRASTLVLKPRGATMGELTLAGTHPHHKHVAPDIKHHRVPASGLSFTQPNLPFLIREIETTLLTQPPISNQGANSTRVLSDR